MGVKHQSCRNSSSSCCSNFLPVRYSTILTLALFFTSFYLFISPFRNLPEPFSLTEENPFRGDLRYAKFPWNKLYFGPSFEKLKLAVFSETWPIGAATGGMKRHASTLYHALAARGQEVLVFTVPSDRKFHHDIHDGNLHVYFAANDHGSVNCSLAFEIFHKLNNNGAFDYVHTESSLEELFSNRNGILPGPMTELQEAMPRLIDEIRLFSSYAQHICLSNSAAGSRFREKHRVPENVSLVMGVAGRLVRDEGHRLLYEDFSLITTRNPAVYLLVAGSGPWGKRPQGLDLTLMSDALWQNCFDTQLSEYSWDSRDEPQVLQRKGMACKEHALSMFAANKMASAYERFFPCMKNTKYCHYPLHTDC
ncbi:hypothetical protein Patl1_04792 [Pistacia atlantica]|uniref:Uncharacterized protein n=1 Tax=Pistacia atlantica TaxID=434234 RepID=A0ACC1BVA0_9ROSI|nr:hypothetical protein Patl1_04792 [Pistacia atlantica]